MNVLRTKVALVGDPRVGKTCIVSQFIKQYFNNTYQTTLGIDYNTHEIKNKDSNLTVQLHILDLTGFSVFRELVNSEIKDANYVLYVYDATNLESFQNIKLWRENVKAVNKNCIELLVGNKIDLGKVTVDDTSVKGYINQFSMKAFSISAVNII